MNYRGAVPKAILYWFLVSTLSACGTVHNAVVLAPAQDVVGIKYVSLAPVQLTSTEQHEDAVIINEQLRRLAHTELVSALTSKGKSLSGTSEGTVTCAINITHGSRALRYFVGMGAGKGRMSVTISLQGPNGIERYSVTSKAELAIGVFGGDMEAVAKDAILKATQDFVSRL